MKFSSENHSGDVNNHSGRIGFFIHFSPESLFTSRRNHYSHHSGTIIHMPRNPQLSTCRETPDRSGCKVTGLGLPNPRVGDQFVMTPQRVSCVQSPSDAPFTGSVARAGGAAQLEATPALPTRPAGPPSGLSVPKRPSIPIAAASAAKRQRLPSSLLIENASARNSRLRPAVVRRGVSDEG